MDIFESYSFLFFDSFFSALILPPRSEMVVHLMAIFSGYNLHLIFILAFIGSCLGSCVDWWIGKYFQFVKKTEFLKNKEKELLEAERKWNKFLVYILLLSWVSVIGNPFAVLAGFLKTDLKKFLILVVIGKVCYYYALVFYGFDARFI